MCFCPNVSRFRKAHNIYWIYMYTRVLALSRPCVGGALRLIYVLLQLYTFTSFIVYEVYFVSIIIKNSSQVWLCLFLCVFPSPPRCNTSTVYIYSVAVEVVLFCKCFFRVKVFIHNNPIFICSIKSLFASVKLCP